MLTRSDHRAIDLLACVVTLVKSFAVKNGVRMHGGREVQMLWEPVEKIDKIKYVFGVGSTITTTECI